MENTAPTFKNATLKYAVLFCCTAFIITRLILLAIGMATQAYLFPIYGAEQYLWTMSDYKWLDIWAAWDTAWFVSIIDHGYSSETIEEFARPGQANTAFFPLYPLLSKFTSIITGLGTVPAMILLSNISFLFALIIIWYEANDIYGLKAANMSVLIMTLIPGSYIFSSAYSEALFLLFVTLSLRNSRLEKIWVAGMYAGLAALTKNLGVLLVLPLAFYAWQYWLKDNDKRFGIQSGIAFTFTKRGIKTFFACLVPALFLIVFMAHLYLKTGDPIAFVTVQKHWEREFLFPIASLILPLMNLNGLPPEYLPSLLMAWMCVVGLFFLAKQRKWPTFVYSVICLTIPLSVGLVSVFRLVLPIVPVWMALAKFIGYRPRFGIFMLVCFGFINAIMMAGWSFGLQIF